MMMSTKKSNMKKDELSIAKPIAPEDVRAGMYIALLHQVEKKSCFWCDCDDDQWWRDRSKRTELSLPWDVEAQFVKAVCLPFVLAETIKGEIETIDTRRYRLARLPKEYGRAAFAKLRRERAKEKAEAENKKETKDADEVKPE